MQLEMSSETMLYRSHFVLAGATFELWSDRPLPIPSTTRLSAHIDSKRSICVEVHVEPSLAGSATVFFRAVANVVSARLGDDFLFMNLSERAASVIVSTASANDARRWNTLFLPIILGVLGPTVGVIPLHAACLCNEQNSFLLAGLSGAGKSTLSVALGLAGYKLLSDDWTYITAQRELVAHGSGVPFKLLLDSARYFDDLDGAAVSQSLNGELAYQLYPADLGIDQAEKCCPKALFILRRRSAKGWDIHPIESNEVEMFFTHSAERLPEHLASMAFERERAIRAVAELPAWTFEYGGTPNDGARYLSCALQEITCNERLC